MNKQTIFFDLDDTLIHCNKYFVEVLKQFAEWMERRFPHIPRKTILQKQLELDLAGVDQYGLKKERFPDSLVETFEFFAKADQEQEIQASDRDALWQLGHQVYEQQFEAYPHMEETLQELQRQGHTLCLYTGGDAEVQESKIEQLELRRYFEDRIFITEHKNTETFKRVLSEHQCKLSHTWMIGNSARTDIIPALEAGTHAIFIPNDLEWEYNRAEINVRPQGVFIELSSLTEVPSVIDAYARTKY